MYVVNFVGTFSYLNNKINNLSLLYTLVSSTAITKNYDLDTQRFFLQLKCNPPTLNSNFSDILT